MRRDANEVVKLGGRDVGNGGALVNFDALTLDDTLHRLGGSIHVESIIPNLDRSNTSIFFTNLLIF